MIHVHGLREEILRAELHGAHRSLDVSLAREQDDGPVLAAQALEDDEPAGVGEVQVENHDVGSHPPERLDACVAGRLAQHLVTEAFEIVPDRAQDACVVIHEQQRVSHAAILSIRPQGPRVP